MAIRMAEGEVMVQTWQLTLAFWATIMQLAGTLCFSLHLISEAALPSYDRLFLGSPDLMTDRCKGLGEQWSRAMWIDVFEWAQLAKVLFLFF